MDMEKLVDFIREENEQTRRHFDVVAESLRSDIGKVAEGVVANTERLDRVDARLDKLEQHAERVDVHFVALDHNFETLNQKVETLDHKVETLDHKVEALDHKLDGFIVETRANFEEVRASIKFSYAELDRRLTFLESGFKDLSSRMASIESRQSH